MYMAVPLNLILWGCESWAMAKASLKKFEVFHIKIKNKQSDVIENRITNVFVRKNFNNIKGIESLISKRRLFNQVE